MTKIRDFDVASLRLDPENPRLPEEMHGASQSKILDFLFQYGTLDELAQSFIDNGFFQHEPLIVLTEKSGKTVIEGNRRLAALMILHGRPEAESHAFAGIEASPKQLAILEHVPGFEIETREEAHRFLGFRHIGGIKTWDADAKARYLLGEVERSVKSGSDDPFREVGRRVGSNAQGVRNSFVAISILRTARDEFGIKVEWVMQQRFGVWLRCMNSPDIKSYIGLDSPHTYKEVKAQLKKLNGKRLTEVVSDLTPPPGKAKAIVSDSRHVTDYGRVLTTESARKALRRFGDLSVAVQLVEYASLPARLGHVVESCKLIYEQLPYAPDHAELREPAEQLQAIATAIRELVGAKAGKR